ncbi:arginine--tRNA ligase [Tenacibaculum finnmarkense genomovar finnmarkense]|uniref:arginine--tRNA ligase n=1 Tax=Tenacibaculum finnmarkense TaxID=2781243 RepID=UPI001E3E3F09|nr:arginine--tRNA ligase [Tenacibaculum finnmarkense]MCD8418170.1 arginine--tRNA ligase [Tenacibaculum finnmarkense genomovar finnmarkense]MCG8186502.1 arginine--tRNA ligase [Tenacibaculum finnmarkense genomovar finnmarkense]MCG8203039.1 arginine--tRNA ligase [Tenacibaculum finnmarkense genomovar finnmarkense]MCG8210396.1 arginine--tRNA ligase [Tenacibaculum finnmarkense genomovar finnmarkense]MCG8213270.1 arginine--tRNA ligase [Tenacibaculum finnmarkense genomovar finnmarkense]
MSVQTLIEAKVKEGFSTLYNIEIPSVEFQATRKDFEGDITVVVFPLLRYKKGNPVQIGEDLGKYLVENVTEITNYNVVKGFLNLVIDDTFYTNFFNQIATNTSYGFISPSADDSSRMVEYSSPNTNKPLHLGHVRNVLLGYSVAEILKASGKKVYKTQIINDRGIHICKSMLAWEKFGNGETPENTGLKGDKLVGNYYVKFDQEYKKEIATLMASGVSEDDAKKQAPLFIEAQAMLRKWEAGDEQVVTLWKEMNSWVYKGFDVTYKSIGVDFDTLYYESNTYLLGKDTVDQGLESGVFYKKEDGSVWCDLSEDGLDEKLVLRSDGTSVYMTQDIGTAIQRAKDMPDVGGMVYTVGNEQDYHFKVLFLILKKLGYSWAEQLHHLSYGMVDLPSGKMKSREGTVVDADDLMDEMTDTARTISQELGKLEGYSDQEKEELYSVIGLGALKYFILKVDPKKRILFDPKASVDFQGNTGPFIQYTYARIQSILRKATFDYSNAVSIELHAKEKELIKQLELYPEVIQQAANNYSPAVIANYTYELVKEFNSFYQNVHILGEENQDKKVFRVQLSKKVADTIKSAFALLGIQVPEKM